MDNFDLRKFLIENKLTRNSQQLDELNLKPIVAAGALALGSLGAQAQMKPEYQKAIAKIQQDYPGRENAGIRRTKIDSIANVNRNDIQGKRDAVRQRAINGFIKLTRPDLVNASPEEIEKAYDAWEKERNKGKDQSVDGLNTCKSDGGKGSCTTGNKAEKRTIRNIR
jgi:hypothetical protein